MANGTATINLAAAYAELEDRREDDRDVLPPVSREYVALYDTQHENPDWSVRDAPAEDQLRADMAQVVAQEDVTFDGSYLDDLDAFFYRMADAVLADHVNNPPEYLHAAVTGFRTDERDLDSFYDAVLAYCAADDVDGYIGAGDDFEPLADHANVLMDDAASPDNIILRELSMEPYASRPDGERVRSNIALDLDDHWLTVKLMEDEEVGYYPLFTLPVEDNDERREERFQAKKRVSMELMQAIEDAVCDGW